MDTLVLVTDSSYRGVQTVHHIEGMVKDGSVPACGKVGVVFNRIQNDDRTEEDFRAAVGLPVFGVVPYDPVLGRCDTEGQSLLTMPEEAASVVAVKKALKEIMGFEI